MRIHTDTLTRTALYEALSDEQRAGRIAPQVNLTVMQHGSRSHARAFEITLSADYKSNNPGISEGRKLRNSGWYGASENSDLGDYGATYDEWGWFLAALYAVDSEMVCGNVKHPTYADRADFEHKTGLTYNPAGLLTYLEGRIKIGSEVAGDPYPYAPRVKPQVGRHGYNRRDGENEPRWALSTPEEPTRNYFKWAPRNAADYRAFAKLASVDAR